MKDRIKRIKRDFLLLSSLKQSKSQNSNVEYLKTFMAPHLKRTTELLILKPYKDLKYIMP